MLDHEEETPAVSSPQSVTETVTVLVPQSTATAGKSTVSASQNSTTAPATQAVQHWTSGPKNIRFQAFIADSNPNETRHWRKKMEKQTFHSFQIFPHLKSSGSHWCSSHLQRRTKTRADWIPQERSYAIISQLLLSLIREIPVQRPFYSHVPVASKLEKMCQKKLNQWLSITCIYGFK